MNALKNLSVIRKLVQIFTFIFFVYGGLVTGYYLEDKISRALPALSCAYDHDGSDYCTLIPIQHQMHHRLGTAIADGGNLLMGIMPTLITLGTFLLLFVILNKAFCGWICPLGTFQEFMHMLGQKLGLQRRESLEHSTVKKIRPVKWFVLVLLVFGFPVLAGLAWSTTTWAIPSAISARAVSSPPWPSVIRLNCMLIPQALPPSRYPCWPTSCSA